MKKTSFISLNGWRQIGLFDLSPVLAAVFDEPLPTPSETVPAAVVVVAKKTTAEILSVAVATTTAPAEPRPIYQGKSAHQPVPAAVSSTPKYRSVTASGFGSAVRNPCRTCSSFNEDGNGSSSCSKNCHQEEKRGAYLASIGVALISSANTEEGSYGFGN